MWLDVLLIWIGGSLPIASLTGKAMKDADPDDLTPLPEKVFASVR